MDEKTQNGYIACVIFVCVSLLSGYLAAQNEFNFTGLLLWLSTGVTALLGVLSFKYPNSVGQIAWRILKYFKKNLVDEKSDSHDYQPRGQTMQECSGSYQVMTTQGDVHINNAPSEKKEHKQHPEEEKENLRRETIIVRPSKGCSYEFSFEEGECLKGEISSTSCIDIYFVDDLNFDKWERDKNFDYEYCNEDVLEADINYVIPDDGNWYLLIENNGRKNAKVKVRLFAS